MSKRKEITLLDIAQELNISRVAVSKALRDHPDISAKTKKNVREVATKLGYVPNFMARNLSSQTSNTIGLVVPKIAHHFFAEAIEAIYQAAYKNDYEVILTVSQENAEYQEKHIETLLAMRVDGLLVSVTEQTKDRQIFEKAKQRGVPLVFFDRVLEGCGCSCVTTDDEKGSFEAIEYLYHSGYKKIAHLAGFQNTNIGFHRSNGFKKAMQKYGLDISQNWFIEGGFGEIDGYKGFKSLFKSGSLPQVIYAVTFPVALGVMLAADELGFSIPGDFDLLCFGGSGYNRFMKPPLTFIRQPVNEIGKTAVDLLIKEIHNPGESAKNIKLPTELIVCETCVKMEYKDE